MPRNIKYTTYIDKQPHEGHLTTSTKVVESIYTIPLRVFSDSSDIHGIRGSTIMFQIQVDTRGYNRPVNLRLGIGLRASDFRILTSFDNILLPHGSVPVSMYIPYDLPLGPNYLWYEIVPIEDEFRSTRSEALTFSFTDPTIRFLNVDVTKMKLEVMTNNVPADMTIYINGMEVVNSKATHYSSYTMDAGLGVNVKVVMKAEGYITKEDHFFMNSDTTRIHNLDLKPTWPSKILQGLSEFKLVRGQMEASQTITIEAGSVWVGGNFPYISSNISEPSLNLTHNVVRTYIDEKGATVSDVRVTVSRSYENTLRTYDTPFNVSVNVDGLSTTTTGVADSSQDIPPPQWDTSIEVNFENPIIGSNTSMEVYGSVTVILGSKYGTSNNFSYSTEIRPLNPVGNPIQVQGGISSQTTGADGKRRFKYDFRFIRPDVTSSGTYEFVINFPDDNLSTYTNIIFYKHVNAVVNVRKRFNRNTSLFHYYKNSTFSSGVTVSSSEPPFMYKTELISNMVPGASNSLPSVYANRNLTTLMYQSSVSMPYSGSWTTVYGAPSHIVKFDPITTSVPPKSVKLHMKITSSSFSADMGFDSGVVVGKLLESSTTPATYTGNVSSMKVVSNGSFFVPSSSIPNGGVITIDLEPNAFSTSDLAAGLALQVGFGAVHNVSNSYNTDLQQINTLDSTTKNYSGYRAMTTLPFFKFYLNFDYTDPNMYEIEVNF